MRILLAQRLTWLPALAGATKCNVQLLQALSVRHACRMLALAGPIEGDTAFEHLQRETATRGIPEIRVSADGPVHLDRGVEFHTAPDAPRLWKLLARQIREFEPDVVLIAEDRTLIGLAVAIEEAGSSRTMYLAQSQTTLPFGPESFAQDPAKTDMLRRAAHIFVPSHYLREYIHRWAGMQADVLAMPMYGAGPFRDWGERDGGHVTMVNPSEIKGIAIFEAMASARPDVSFAAVPTWATTTADRARLARLPNVTLLAPADEIDDILAHTRVLVVPSLWGESFGRVVVEAMLRGIPVLASDSGGLREAKLGVPYLLPIRPIERYGQQRDERGLPIPSVPPQDVHPWLDALDRLLGDRDHYRDISAASRRAALAHIAQLDYGLIEATLEAHASARGSRPREESPVAPVSLSPQRLELLAALVRRERESS